MTRIDSIKYQCDDKTSSVVQTWKTVKYFMCYNVVCARMWKSFEMLNCPISPFKVGRMPPIPSTKAFENKTMGAMLLMQNVGWINERALIWKLWGCFRARESRCSMGCGWKENHQMLEVEQDMERVQGSELKGWEMWAWRGERQDVSRERIRIPGTLSALLLTCLPAGRGHPNPIMQCVCVSVPPFVRM